MAEAKARARGWVFVVNNYTENDYEVFETLFKLDLFKYIVYGKEVGEEKQTPHLQGFFYLHNQKTKGAMLKLLKRHEKSHIHIEQMRGTTAEAIAYCKKDGEVTELGEQPKQGHRSDIDALRQDMKDRLPMHELQERHAYFLLRYPQGCKLLRTTCLRLDEPYDHDTVRGIYIWGPPRMGKSTYVRNNYEDIYMKQQSKWWDGYEGEKTVLLDNLNTHTLCHYLKIWLDKFGFRGEIKGGTICPRYTTFIITSNYSLDDPKITDNDPIMALAIKERCEIKHITSKRL